MEVLRSAGLADVCCVVTRYFGGTLLGPGGLKRAYASATQEALAVAEGEGALVQKTLVTRVTCVIPYAAYGRVERLVSDCGGKVKDTVFAEDVQLTAVFRAGEEKRYVDAMRELAVSEGMVGIDYIGKRYDMGNKLGILQANIEVGLKHPEVGEGLREYLKELAKTL